MAVTEGISWRLFYTGSRTDLNTGDRFYHGTRANLKPGDLIKPAHLANFGKLGRLSNYVYFSATLDAGIWPAELARRDGPGRICMVAPTGLITDDPNLTDKKFPGNPTKSYRTGDPLRVMEEFIDLQGHAPQALQAMKDRLEQLKQEGAEAIDD